MLTEIKTDLVHYFLDENNHCQGEFESYHYNGVLCSQRTYLNSALHGEYKEWWSNGQIREHAIYKNSELHGEYKHWSEFGHELITHCFFVNNVRMTEKDIPIPSTPEDLLYFKLKYNLPLLPVEQTC